MALADSSRAVGAVTRLLVNHLSRQTELSITTGRPEQAASSGGNPKLNIFLYETQFDGSLRNLSLDEGRPPPLWLVLKYLLTSFDEGGNSDSATAHELLGLGMSSLQELSFLLLEGAVPSTVIRALEKNPEPLKITFDDASVELLSKVMQGTDERYRLSVAFQVRPVLIAPAEPPSYSLLVGIDYTAAPARVIGEDGIDVAVLPLLGPALEEVAPLRFELNETIELSGHDLHVGGLEVRLGPASLAVSAQRPHRLRCVVDGSLAGGTVLSAGSLPLAVRQALPSGRFRSSNLLAGNLLPTVTGVSTNSLALNSDGDVFGNLVLTGRLLGTAADDIFVAFYQSGTVTGSYDQVTSVADQTQLTLAVPSTNALPPGNYRIILRVNGQQAKRSPEVRWSP